MAALDMSLIRLDEYFADLRGTNYNVAVTSIKCYRSNMELYMNDSKLAMRIMSSDPDKYYLVVTYNRGGLDIHRINCEIPRSLVLCIFNAIIKRNIALVAPQIECCNSNLTEKMIYLIERVPYLYRLFKDGSYDKKIIRYIDFFMSMLLT